MQIAQSATPSKTDEFRVNNFDLIRLFAAVEVMLKHTSSHLKIPLPELNWLFGAFPGVSILFIVSGYLISGSFGSVMDIPRYASARWKRIFPALWGVIILTVGCYSILGADFFRIDAIVWLGLQSIGVIYTPGFLKDFGIGSYNGSLWTIPVNLQFYVFLPILFFVGRSRKWFNVGLVVLLIGSLAVSYYLRQRFSPEGRFGDYGIGKLVRYSLAPHLFLFLMGVLLRRFEFWRYRWLRRKGIWWVVAYLSLWRFLPEGHGAFILRSIVLAFCILSVAYTLPELSSKTLRGFDASYGIFVYHGLIINIFAENGMVGKFEYLLFVVCITVVLASVSWVYLEKPIMKK